MSECKVNTNCTGCKFFLSYAQDWDSDLEPFDAGYCTNPESKRKNDHIDKSDVCDKFTEN